MVVVMCCNMKGREAVLKKKSHTAALMHHSQRRTITLMSPDDRIFNVNCLCLQVRDHRKRSASEYLPSRIRWSTTLQQKLGNIQASVLGGHMEGSEAFLHGDKAGRNIHLIVTVLKINAIRPHKWKDTHCIL